MAKIRNIKKSQVNFNDVMLIAQDAIMSRLNCHNIGRIIAFDKNTQTCTVEMMQIKQFNDQTFIPAPITQVPLIMLGSGGGIITMPNPVGTICLLLFLDRNIDNFMETGEQYTPETSRMHDITDCIALTTFTTLANPLTNYDEEAITLLNDNIIENVQKISYIKIYPNNIQIEAADNIKLEKTNGAQIAINDKVSISNLSQNLGTLITALLTACEEISTVNGGGLTPTSKQKFTNLIAQFQALIETPGE